MSCTHEWRIDYVPVDECQKCHARKEEVEAFRRGAEAMREACVEETRRVFDVFQGYPPSLEVRDSLRVLPIPEEP